MKKLNIYILKSYASPFVATFTLVLFFLIMQFFWLYVDDLVGKGLSFWLIIKLLFYISFSLVPMALPLGVLLSSIMTFGDFSENYELAAMKSAGVSLYQIMKPLIVLMGLLSIFTYYFSNYAVPYANFKSKNLLYNITKQKPSLNLKEGIFNVSIPGYSIRIDEKFGKEGDRMKGIVIYDHNGGKGNNKVITAKEGKMEMAGGGAFMKLTLIDGYMFEEAKKDKPKPKDKKRQPFNKTKFGKDVVYIDISSFNMDNIDDEKFKNNYAMMNINQLNTAIDSLNISYNKTLDTYVERSQRKLRTGKNITIDSVDYVKAKFITESKEFVVGADSTALSTVLNNNIILSNFVKKGDKTNIVNSAINHANKMYSFINKDVANTQKYRKANLAKYIMEVHRKYAFAYIILVMFFIGAPLGAIIRKGGMGMPVVVAIMIFIIYHVMYITFEKLGKAGELTPFWARWLPSLILTPFGILLTRKATTDSAIFNSEIYFAPFYKFFEHVKKFVAQQKEKKINK
ncbi:MAG: LptF/LptG family permease [Ichthyobacteriaceae bacterium]|nr:LptF/LptG family permease [Ichthyobacteriaceae bacterium]